MKVLLLVEDYFEVANADEIQTYEIPYPHNFP